MTNFLGTPSTGVIVTGAASGIGRATARAMAEVGRPVALWDISGEAAQEAAESIIADTGTLAIARTVDMGDPDAVAAAAAEARTKLPSIGGFVHAAGMAGAGRLEDISLDQWQAVIDVHLRAVVLLVKAFSPDMRQHPGSAAVAITSINATLGNKVVAAYTAAKGGMLSLMRAVADDWGADGMRANSVSPGLIRTPMANPSIQMRGADFYANKVYLGHPGEPEDIASVVRFLMSNEARYVTGAELVVDGGYIRSQG